MTRLQIVKDGPYYVLIIKAQKNNAEIFSDEEYVVEIEIARDFQLNSEQIAALDIALNDGIIPKCR